MARPARGVSQPLSDLAATDDLRHAVEQWRASLAGAQQVSRHTLGAYTRDVSGFLSFLGEYDGEAPSLKSLRKLTVRDLRAWLAGLRREGLSSRSVARQLSSLASCPFRYQGVSALAAVSVLFQRNRVGKSGVFRVAGR